MLKNLLTIMFYDPDKGWVKDDIKPQSLDENKPTELETVEKPTETE